MPLLIDMTGKKYGGLTAIKRVPSSRRGGVRYLFRCDFCGNEKKIAGEDVRCGKTTSCGCVRRRVTAERMTKHGHAPRSGLTREYRIWRNMIQRCENEASTGYKYYGGRGIKVCPEWHDFSKFIIDMGSCPKRLTIDRINNNGNYEPGNCRWATYSEQSKNRRSTRFVTFNGETLPFGEFAKKVGISWSTLRQRLDKFGLTLSQAISVPRSDGGTAIKKITGSRVGRPPGSKSHK